MGVARFNVLDAVFLHRFFDDEGESAKVADLVRRLGEHFQAAVEEGAGVILAAS